MNISPEMIEKYTHQLVDGLVFYTPKLLVAFLVLFVGVKLSNVISRKLKSTLANRDVEPTLIPFLGGLVSAVLKIIVVVTVISMLGIQTTSIVTALGAAGLAIGLALQGSLSNFAGGVIILLLRPFKVGEVIDAGGNIGEVTQVHIFHTYLKTYDHRVIILPNGPLANSNVINFSREKTRKVEWVFGIGYGDDIDKAREIIIKEVYSDSRVLTKEDDYFVNVAVLNSSSVDFKVRAEVAGDDYWDVLFDKMESVKKAFDANGISIPFPQQDLHIHKVD